MGNLVKLLFIVMLAARSLLPAGFMLQVAPTGDGRLEIVICTGHGPQTITLDRDGKPAQQAPIKADAGICPYAASAPVAVAAAVPDVIHHPPRFSVVAFASPAESFRVLRYSGATSARGPPYLQV